MDLFAAAGERVWVRISDVVRNPIGSRLYTGALGFLEPSVGQILHSLVAEPNLGTDQGRLKIKTLRRMIGFVLRLLLRVIYNLGRPEKARLRLDSVVEQMLASCKIEPGADLYARLANVLAFMRKT